VVADPQNISCPGDTVVFVTNTDAVQAFDAANTPVNASIVELVDSLE
jgi:microcompartment protein CcmK/EutM